MDQENTVVFKNKSGVTFTRIKNHHYKISFELNNNRLILPNIMNIDILELLYILNKDIYEYSKLVKVNDKEAILINVVKPFFKDLGLPQRFCHLKIEQTLVNDRNIQFKSTTLYEENPLDENIPANAQIVPIKSMIADCEIKNAHSLLLTQTIIFDERIIPVIPLYMEKMLGHISSKIFTRMKQFIEDMDPFQNNSF